MIDITSVEREPMNIKIHSRHVDNKLKVAMHAMCEFALARLQISNRLRNNLNLTIHMKHHDNEGEARVGKDANRYRPRHFDIFLDHHRMEKDDYGRSLEDTEWGHRVLKVLAHELVHVKQYIMGELSWRDAGLLWHGKNFDPKNILNYYELPYEIEAHGREYGLLVGFLVVWNNIEKEMKIELDNLV